MDKLITQQLNTIVKSTNSLKYSMLNQNQLKFLRFTPNKDYYAIKYLQFITPDDDIFDLLITSENINNIISFDQKTTTLLIHACEHGRIDLIEKLLKMGADPELKNNGVTVLGTACVFGHIDIIQLLLAYSVDPNNLSNGVLPIVLFIQNNKDIFNGFMLLFNNGANINHPVNTINNTIIFSLLQNTDPSTHVLIEFLFDNGLDININNYPYIGKFIYENRPPISSLDMLLNNISLNSKDPINILDEQYLFNKILLLLDNCINPNNHYLEQSPLELALSFKYYNLAKLLLLGGADHNVSTSSFPSFYDNDLNFLLGLN